MELKQYADNDGKFYHPKTKEGDKIKNEDTYGFIQYYVQRDQFADTDGTIVWLEESGKKVVEGDVICIINDEIQSEVVVVISKSKQKVDS